MQAEPRHCTRCILDTTVPEIKFDEHGVCNFCKLHDVMNQIYPTGVQGESIIQATVKKMKKSGKGRAYDCIVGVSGGTDSTYCLYLAKKWGLRPLAVHFDNGWDSEIAVTNIKNATDKLGIDLYTYVTDWEEFKKLQIAFLKASTPDAEVPTDLGLLGALYRSAIKEKVKYIINGHSFRTEGTSPTGWTYMDGKYVLSVYRQFTDGRNFKVFPNLSLSNLVNYTIFKRLRLFEPLEYMDYDKAKAGKMLEKDVGWSYYGGHHHECLYTKFHHNYLLPKKFNIEYRKVSLSAQVRSGIITRDEALSVIKNNPPELDAQSLKYVINKLGLTEAEFNNIMALPPKKFSDYPTYYPTIKRLRWFVKTASKYNLIPHILYLKYSNINA